MQPDTLIPGVDSPQSWNRFSYVTNSPLGYVDPSGHAQCRTQEDCDDMGTTPMGGSGNSGGNNGGGDEDEDDLDEELDPTVVVFCGSYASNEPGYTINDPGPECKDQLPAWYWNPWGLDMQHIQYPGSKYQQYHDALNVNIGGDTILVCYSSGAEACLMYAKARIEAGYGVPYMVLMGPTFSGADSLTGSDIGVGGWYEYLDFALNSGAGVTVIDDGLPQNTAGDLAAHQYDAPNDTTGFYQVVSAFPFLHNDTPGPIGRGINNSYIASFLIYGCVGNPLNCSSPDISK